MKLVKYSVLMLGLLVCVLMIFCIVVSVCVCSFCLLVVLIRFL